MYSQCVTENEILANFFACQNSACRGHFSGTLTSQKAWKAGYYLPNMFQDCHIRAEKCNACYRYARDDLLMNVLLNVSLPLVSFEKWEIDYIREIHPGSSPGMQYIDTL